MKTRNLESCAFFVQFQLTVSARRFRVAPFRRDDGGSEPVCLQRGSRLKGVTLTYCASFLRSYSKALHRRPYEAESQVAVAVARLEEVAIRRTRMPRIVGPIAPAAATVFA